MKKHLKLLVFIITGLVLYLNTGPLHCEQIAFLNSTDLFAGENRLSGNKDFITDIPAQPGLPTNWETRINYRDGKYKFKVDVMEMQDVDSKVAIQFGWRNSPYDSVAKHTISDKIYFTSPGTYEITRDLKTIKKYYGSIKDRGRECNMWFWDIAFNDQSLYISIDPLSNKPGKEGFPFKIRTSVKIISKGSTADNIDELNEFVSVNYPIIKKNEEAVFKLNIENPFKKQVKAVVKWNLSKTSWEAEQKEIIIPAGKNRKLEVKVNVGKNILPFPFATVDLISKGRILTSRDFLTDVLSETGLFVRDWNVVGPFSIGVKQKKGEHGMKTNKRYMAKGMKKRLPPEKKLNLNKTYKGKDKKKIRWQLLKGVERMKSAKQISRTANKDGNVNLDTIYNCDYAAAFAVSYIYSPEKKEYEMSVGGDDSILVRINGKEVWRNHTMREAFPDLDVFTAELDKGWNEIFLKVVDGWQGWGFYFRVLDQEGDLKLSTEPL